MKLIITESQLKTIIKETSIPHPKEDVNEDVVRLRTLTKKSIWDVTQKYKGMTVGEIMEVHPSTLYWGYCKVEWLNFTPDILEELNYKFYQHFNIIDKPGTDIEQLETFIKRKDTHNLENISLPRLKKIVLAMRINGRKPDLDLLNAIKTKQLNYKREMMKSNPSKIYMQNKNHGLI